MALRMPVLHVSARKIHYVQLSAGSENTLDFDQRTLPVVSAQVVQSQARQNTVKAGLTIRQFVSQGLLKRNLHSKFPEFRPG